MSWIAITEEDLLTRMSGSELEAFRAAGLTEGQGDPIATIILAVVEEIRGYIAAGGYTLGLPETIPVRLASAALDRIVWEVMKRPGATIMDTNDARKEANEAALRLFREVAAGRFAIEDPATGETNRPSAAWGSEERLAL